MWFEHIALAIFTNSVLVVVLVAAFGEWIGLLEDVGEVIAWLVPER